MVVKARGGKPIQTRPESSPGPQWQHIEAQWRIGQRLVADVEAEEARIETAWQGRVRLLVPPELRERFDSQRRKYTLARDHGTIDDLREQQARMLRALAAVDAKARAMYSSRPRPDQWQVRLADGSLLVIVREAAETRWVTGEGPMQVWSLEEIARLIEGQPDVVQALKARFRGAVVTAAKGKEPEEQGTPFVDGDLDDFYRLPKGC